MKGTPLSLLSICLRFCAIMTNTQTTFPVIPTELTEIIEIIRARKIFVIDIFYFSIWRNKIRYVARAEDTNKNVIESDVTCGNLMSVLEKLPTPFIAREYARISKRIKEIEIIISQINEIYAKNAELLDPENRDENKIKIMRNIYFEMLADY